MLEIVEEAKRWRSERNLEFYVYEDGSVKEGKICQVIKQGKKHLYHYSLSIGWEDPTHQRIFVGMQQEMQKVFTGWSSWYDVLLND